MHNSGGVISQPGIAKCLLSTSYKCWVTLCTNSPFVRGDPPRETGSTKVLFWNSFVTVNSTVTMIFSHYLSKNMTLNFSYNWVQIKSTPCKWIFPPGTAYWEYHLPPSGWHVSCTSLLSPLVSLSLPNLLVFVSYHISTSTPQHNHHREITADMWSVKWKQHWMNAVCAKCSSRALLSSDIVNHHYLIIIPVTLWLSIPVMTIETSCQPCSGMICPDNPELVTRYWQGPGESPGPRMVTSDCAWHSSLVTESRAGKSVDTNVWSVWEQSLVWIISNTQL